MKKQLQTAVFGGKFLYYGLGIIIITLGVNIMLKGNFGIMPYDAIDYALAKRMDIPVAVTMAATGILVILLGGLVRKKFPRFTTLITALIMGACSDFWLWVGRDITPQGLGIRIGCFVVGITLLAFGLALYLCPGWPTNPPDDFIVALSERTGRSMGKCKLCFDAICFILAILLKSKGTIGIGSGVCVFTIGPLIDVFSKLVKSHCPQGEIWKEKEEVK